jgi:hypothetical protein
MSISTAFSSLMKESSMADHNPLSILSQSLILVLFMFLKRYLGRRDCNTPPIYSGLKWVNTVTSVDSCHVDPLFLDVDPPSDCGNKCKNLMRF